MKKTSPRAELIAGTLASLCVLEATAAQAVSVRIEAQPLPTALNEFVSQSGVQLLFPSSQWVDSVMAPRVVGEFAPAAALSQLLSNSGLRFEFVNANTIAIRQSARESAGPDSARVLSDAKESANGRGIPEVLIQGSQSLNADVVRSQDDTQPYVIIDQELIEKSAATNVGDLLRSFVTMNYVARPSQQAGSDNSSSVALRGLSESQTLILIDGRRVSEIGHGGSQFQPDLNGIPISAIERIEVLPATASGIYGGSATGGVVNVILRRDYAGVETRVKYENSFAGGGRSRAVDVSGGFSFNGGDTSLMLIGSFTETDPLVTRQRSFPADYLERANANLRAFDPGYFRNGSPPLGATPNVSAVAAFTSVPAETPGAFCFEGNCFALVAPDLTLKAQYGGSSLGAAVTHVPNGYTSLDLNGTQAYVQNAGTYNLQLADSAQLGAGNYSLIAESSVRTADITLRHQFSPRFESFLSISGSKNEGSFNTAPNSTFTISASAPNNPFDQDINVTVPIQLRGQEETETDSYRAIIGTKMRLGSAWSASVEYSFSKSKRHFGDVSQVLRQDLFDNILSGAVDILSTPPEGGFDFSEYILPAAAYKPGTAYAHVATARSAGPIVSLPAGAIVLTTLVEHTQQQFGDYVNRYVDAFNIPHEYTYSDQSSDVTGVYAEAQIPVIEDNMRIPALREVSFQIAGRFDSYNNTGGVSTTDGSAPQIRPEASFHAFSPTFGLRVRPIESVLLRASYGRGYFPPSLNLLNPSPPFVLGFTGLADPKRGNEQITNLTVFVGGNPDLEPEKSKSTSVGLVLTPVSSLRLSFDWTKISKKDNVSVAQFSKFYIDAEDQVPGVVIRSTDPSTFDTFGIGPIIAFNGAYRNATRALSESYDISLSYLFEHEEYGSFQFFSNATRLLHSQLQVAPAVPSLENAGLSSMPSWQANASLIWEWRGFSAAWFSKYLDSGWLDNNRAFSAGHGSARLPSQTTHDAAFEYDLKNFFTSNPVQTSVQFGIKNVFSTKPRFNGYFVGQPYDSWTSPMMATYYMAIKASF